VPKSRWYSEAAKLRGTRNSFQNARLRCTKPNALNWNLYGGLGVKFRFASFEEFVASVGMRPSPRHSIDRWPDREGDYRPGNVRWATQRQQIHNRRPRKDARQKKSRRRFYGVDSPLCPSQSQPILPGRSTPSESLPVPPGMSTPSGSPPSPSSYIHGRVGTSKSADFSSYKPTTKEKLTMQKHKSSAGKTTPGKGGQPKSRAQILAEEMVMTTADSVATKDEAVSLSCGKPPKGKFFRVHSTVRADVRIV
jgi:hypothetical protein